MIGKLRGTVDSFGPDWVIVDVHGVGYVVHCSTRTIEATPAAGEAVVMFIDTQMREQDIRLFGFQSEVEREWFRLLQTVQSVGSKVALGILGTLRPNEIATAISAGDKAMIARAPGVGPKVAARICAELKDKAPGLAGIDIASLRLQAGVVDGAATKPAAEAVSALVNLGYGQAQAAAAIAAALAEAGEAAETARLIRLGLRELAR